MSSVFLNLKYTSASLPWRHVANGHIGSNFKQTKLMIWKSFFKVQMQPCSGVLRERCSANMQQIYRRTPFVAYLQNAFY